MPEIASERYARPEPSYGYIVESDAMTVYVMFPTFVLIDEYTNKEVVPDLEAGVVVKSSDTDRMPLGQYVYRKGALQWQKCRVKMTFGSFTTRKE